MTGRLVAILVLMTVSIAGGAAQKKKPKPKPPLEASETVCFFGLVPQDAWTSHHYLLTNKHKDTVTIVDVIPGCDCTHTPNAPIAIAPGETYPFRVLFDSRTYHGETNREIEITTDYKPNPVMNLFFTSAVGLEPKTVRIEPRSTALIPGKDSQTFAVTNLAPEETRFTVFLDHDSILTVSELAFTLKPDETREITVSPVWDRIAAGSTSSCLVLEAARTDIYRFTIPVRITNY